MKVIAVPLIAISALALANQRGDQIDGTDNQTSRLVAPIASRLRIEPPDPEISEEEPQTSENQSNFRGD